MRTKEGFRLRSLGKEFILVGEGTTQVNFNKMIAFNNSAAYLWRSVDGKEFTVDTLVQLLLDEYDVDPATAENDAKAIVGKWLEAEIITK